MQIDITGHHVDITPALRNYVHAKLERLERHSEPVSGMHVVLTVNKLEHRAEASLQVTRGKLFAEAVESDMYAAIDALSDKLARQVTKHKEKLSDHSDRASVRTDTVS